MATSGNGSSHGPTAGAQNWRDQQSGRPPAGVKKYNLSGRNVSGEPVSWREVDAAFIVDAICAVTDVGDAVMFSRTTDGGAYSLTVMSGGKSDKAWPKNAEEANELLLQLVAGAR